MDWLRRHLEFSLFVLLFEIFFKVVWGTWLGILKNANRKRAAFPLGVLMILLRIPFQNS